MKVLCGTDEICAFMRCEGLSPAVKEVTVAVWEKLGAPIFYLPGTAGEPRVDAGELLRWAHSLGARRGWHWKLWLTVMLASMMPTVVLLIASLLLLDLTPLTTEDGSIWLRLVAR